MLQPSQNAARVWADLCLQCRKFKGAGNVGEIGDARRIQELGLRDPNVQRSYYYVDTGLIAANVYLFAASIGLAAWFHNCDKAQLSTKLSLREDQRVLFGQTVGYPLKKGQRGSP